MVSVLMFHKDDTFDRPENESDPTRIARCPIREHPTKSDRASVPGARLEEVSEIGVEAACRAVIISDWSLQRTSD
jgi:hypothetical protein